jgi:hypothetical protein
MQLHKSSNSQKQKRVISSAFFHLRIKHADILIKTLSLTPQ